MKHYYKFFFAILFLFAFSFPISAQVTHKPLDSYVLMGNPGPINNGGSSGWAMLLNLIAGPSPVHVTGMSIGTTAGAGNNFTLELYTRTGNALGGPVTSGPGSTSDGWTLKGTVTGTQGSTSNGVSLPFTIPVIDINAGDTVGVAVKFISHGPRYYGTGTTSPTSYTDGRLTLVTGDVRTAPFTTTGLWFSSRELVGEIDYDVVTPVELTTFTASILKSGNAVELKWSTATEINNSGFYVERKSESADWNTVGFVKGQGTSTSVQSYSFTDKNLSTGSFSYRLKQTDFDGSFKNFDLTKSIEIDAPQSFDLLQNYPNPFNPSTIIKWQIKSDSHVTLKVYDNLGKEIATLVNENRPAGTYETEFNASGIANGVYFYRITAGDFTSVKKMTVLK